MRGSDEMKAVASGEGIEPPPSAFEARRSSVRAAPIGTPHRDSDPGLHAGGVPSCHWTMRGCTTGRTRTSVSGFGIRCPGRWTTVIDLCDRAVITPGRRSAGRRDRCSGMPPRPDGESWWGAQDSNLVPSIKSRMHRRICLHPGLGKGANWKGLPPHVGRFRAWSMGRHGVDPCSPV